MVWIVPGEPSRRIASLEIQLKAEQQARRTTVAGMSILDELITSMEEVEFNRQTEARLMQRELQEELNELRRELEETDRSTTLAM